MRFYIGELNSGDEALKFNGKEDFLDAIRLMVTDAEREGRAWFSILTEPYSDEEREADEEELDVVMDKLADMREADQQAYKGY